VDAAGLASKGSLLHVHVYSPDYHLNPGQRHAVAVHPSHSVSMATARKKKLPQLTAKVQPAQQRSTDTYERILDVTAETLADVGIERLSTNLVCERAALSPPALYRYFPNKYAILSELGKRLMLRQDELVEQWMEREVFLGSAQDLEAALEGLIKETYKVTKKMVGGVWIMRALRAVPTLQEVRLESHRMVTETQARSLIEALPDVDPAQLRLVSRVVVELVYATVEMLFDEPMEVTPVAKVVASMMASQLDLVRPR
jgi:AcrR family transcriptional regulator